MALSGLSVSHPTANCTELEVKTERSSSGRLVESRMACGADMQRFFQYNKDKCIANLLV